MKVIKILKLKDYLDLGSLLGAAGTCLQAAAPVFGGGGAGGAGDAGAGVAVDAGAGVAGDAAAGVAADAGAGVAADAEVGGEGAAVAAAGRS